MRVRLFLLLSVTAVVLMGCRGAGPVDRVEETEPAFAFRVPVIRLLDEGDAERRANNLAALQKLEAVVSIPRGTVTFKAVLDRIRDTTGLKVTVNWDALDLVAIKQDTPLLLDISHLSADYLLRLTLDYVSSDAFDDDKAGFSIDDGIVLISTRRDLKSETRTGIYDIAWYIVPHDQMQRWLYRKDPRAKQLAEINLQRNGLLDRIKPPAFDLNDALSGASSGSAPQRHGNKKALNVFTGPEEELVNLRLDELTELIQTSVGDPDEWLDEESTITAIKDRLVIKTTRENHTETEALLTGLYRSQAEQFLHQARLIEVYLLLDEAETYRLKQRYPQALSLVKKALRVDPGNAEAWALHELITETMSR